jgi:NADH-quinone oxidoreductase subunit K
MPGLLIKTSFCLFFVAIAGILLVRSQLLHTLICLELAFFSVNSLLIAFGGYHSDFMGSLFALFALTVSAAESAIGLSILVAIHRRSHSLLYVQLPYLNG